MTRHSHNDSGLSQTLFSIQIVHLVHHWLLEEFGHITGACPRGKPRSGSGWWRWRRLGTQPDREGAVLDLRDIFRRPLWWLGLILTDCPLIILTFENVNQRYKTLNKTLFSFLSLSCFTLNLKSGSLYLGDQTNEGVFFKVPDHCLGSISRECWFSKLYGKSEKFQNVYLHRQNNWKIQPFSTVLYWIKSIHIM